MSAASDDVDELPGREDAYGPDAEPCTAADPAGPSEEIIRPISATEDEPD